MVRGIRVAVRKKREQIWQKEEDGGRFALRVPHL
jgi:hypothetical protein